MPGIRGRTWRLYAVVGGTPASVVAGGVPTRRTRSVPDVFAERSAAAHRCAAPAARTTTTAP
ncbi:hypothetical protein ACFUJR_04780 [Streptomyces sp. NPDC057271]|uniref:hypothetical protein n=1 Tax=unclassified Streptomyces TaxID=2593676 RepID=UPI003626CD98